MGLPSSIKIKIEETINNGEVIIKKIIEKNLSIKILKKRLIP